MIVQGCIKKLNERVILPRLKNGVQKNWLLGFNLGFIAWSQVG